MHHNNKRILEWEEDRYKAKVGLRWVTLHHVVEKGTIGEFTLSSTTFEQLSPFSIAKINSNTSILINIVIFAFSSSKSSSSFLRVRKRFLRILLSGQNACESGILLRTVYTAQISILLHNYPRFFEFRV